MNFLVCFHIKIIDITQMVSVAQIMTGFVIVFVKSACELAIWNDTTTEEIINYTYCDNIKK